MLISGTKRRPRSELVQASWLAISWPTWDGVIRSPSRSPVTVLHVLDAIVRAARPSERASRPEWPAQRRPDQGPVQAKQIVENLGSPDVIALEEDNGQCQCNRWIRIISRR